MKPYTKLKRALSHKSILSLLKELEGKKVLNQREKWIVACIKTYEKYYKVDSKHHYLYRIDCQLCILSKRNCDKCILSNSIGHDLGCTDFKSAPRSNNEIEETSKARANFYARLINTLKQIEPKKFRVNMFNWDYENL